MPKTTALANKMTAGEKTAKIADQRGEIRELKSELKDLERSYSARVSAFLKKDLPAVATYAGAGAALGGLVAYFLHDRMKEWFDPGSYIGLLGTTALGVVVIVATPSVFKVSRSKMAEQAPMQAAAYGFGTGMVAAGGYLAYRDWPQA